LSREAWRADSWIGGDSAEARQALARRRRRRRRRQLLGWSVVAALSCLALYGLGLAGNAFFLHLRERTSLFSVRQVDVGHTEWVPPWEIVDISGTEPGDDLLALSTTSIARRVTDHPRIASATVQRTWARTVHIDVIERPPVALWLGKQPEEVAADGTVLGIPPKNKLPEWPVPGRDRARGLNLPLITGVTTGELHPGDVVIDSAAREALAFLALCRSYGEPGEEWLSEIWAGKKDDLIAVTLEGGISVRIGDGRLTQKKIQAVRSVIERLHPKDTAPVLVDARFRHQVIVKTEEAKPGEERQAS
jgi:POTRA domain-containing FtsQ-type protein